MKIPFPPAFQEKVEALSLLQRVLIFVATILILGGSFYFLKYKPQLERVTSLQKNIARNKKRLAELKRASAEVETLKKQLAESEEEFAHLLALLPDQKEIPGLLDSVSQLGAQVGLENILFQPQPEQVHEFYAVIPVRLDLVGTYHELGIFFDKLSKLSRILKVDNLSLKRRSGSILQVSCRIITYRFLEQAKSSKKGKKGKKK